MPHRAWPAGPWQAVGITCQADLSLSAHQPARQPAGATLVSRWEWKTTSMWENSLSPAVASGSTRPEPGPAATPPDPSDPRISQPGRRGLRRSAPARCAWSSQRRLPYYEQVSQVAHERDAGQDGHRHGRACLAVADEARAADRGARDGQQAGHRRRDGVPLPGADGASQYVHRGDEQEQAQPGVHGEYYGLARQRPPEREGDPVPPVGGRGMDVKVDADAEPVLGDEHQRDAQAVAAQAGDPARLPGRVCMRRGHATADRLGVVRSHCELPPCPDEQITDRRAEDAGCIALVDLAGPDAVRARVDESDAR